MSAPPTTTGLCNRAQANMAGFFVPAPRRVDFPPVAIGPPLCPGPHPHVQYCELYKINSGLRLGFGFWLLLMFWFGLYYY